MSPPADRVISWGYFTRSVPALVRLRVTGPRDPLAPPSAPATAMTLLAMGASLAIVTAAFQSARNGSAAGKLLMAIGGAGALIVLCQSAWSARAAPINPRAFALGTFVACVALGFDIGLAIGRGTNVDTSLRIGYAGLGALAGYLVGGVAGLYTQRLGWLAGFVSVMAFGATLGLILLAKILFL